MATDPVAKHAPYHQPGQTDALDWLSMLSRGSHAGRPAASSSNKGKHYQELDTPGQPTYRSTGTAWEGPIATASSVVAVPPPGGYVPTLTAATTNPDLGTGAIQTGFFNNIEGWVHGTWKIVVGTSPNAGSGLYDLSLPQAVNLDASNSGLDAGDITFVPAATGIPVKGTARFIPGDTLRVQLLLEGTTPMSSSVPSAIVAGDTLSGVFMYPVTLPATGGGGGGGGTVLLPDVIVVPGSFVTIPPAPTTADSVRFGFTIKNTGAAATPAGTILGVVVEVDGSSFPVVWSDSDSQSLAPGDSVVLQTNAGNGTWTTGTVPGLTVGTHAAVATVDNINRFPEANEANNSLSISFPVVTAPGGPPPPPPPPSGTSDITAINGVFPGDGGTPTTLTNFSNTNLNGNPIIAVAQNSVYGGDAGNGPGSGAWSVFDFTGQRLMNQGLPQRTPPLMIFITTSMCNKDDGGTASTRDRATANHVNDVHWQRFLAPIATAGLGARMYLRFGSEGDIPNGYPWAGQSDPQAYKDAFAEMATYWRANLPGCKTVYTMNGSSNLDGSFVAHPYGSGLTVGEILYPGDAYVDVVASDVYYSSQNFPASPTSNINAVDLKLTHGQAMAVAHGKDYAVTEWGIKSDSLHNGGDFTAYVDHMAGRLAAMPSSGAGKLLTHIYFDQFDPLSSHPNCQIRYRQLFGA